ncbi:plant UBX domain-containing protein 7-like protein [Tanacetum coccineum]
MASRFFRCKLDTSKEEQKRQGVWDAAQGGSTSATEYSNKNLASLYHPPFALMFNGPFEKAKEAANRQDRWLLVNLQSTKEFNSHMLNRDTWGNEAVAQTITSNFIFWQVDNFVKIYPGVTHGWTELVAQFQNASTQGLYSEGEALSWYRWSKGRTPFHTSYMGKIQKATVNQFQQSQQGDPVEQFLSINQAGTTREYVALFEKLVGISEEVVEATFIKGLKSDLRETMRVMKTEGLSHAMELAISIEDYTEVLCCEEEEEEASRDEDDHIHLDIVEVSLNYVLGFTPLPTMKLREYIHAVDVVVLANCGATYNFIAQRLLDQLGLEDTRSKIVGVILGNVKVEKSQGICKRVLVTFPKMQINEGFFLLN